MAQKGIIKNTIQEGYVDASDFADIFNSIIGSDGIIDYKNKLDITKINNNTVRLKSGIYNLRGHLLKVDTTIDLVVESGTLGVKRCDYVIAEYIKNGVESGTDSLHFRVLRGTPSSTIPSKPTLINTSTTYQSIVFELYIDGTNISIVSNPTNYAINIEQTEVIWNGKLQGAERISLNVGKYKRLRFYFNSQHRQNTVFEIDLTNPISDPVSPGYLYTMGHSYPGITDLTRLFSIVLSVNAAKTEIWFNGISFRDGGGPATGMNNNGAYYIWKIEGMY